MSAGAWECPDPACLEGFLLAKAFGAELAALAYGEPAGGDKDGRDEGEGNGVRRNRSGDARVLEGKCCLGGGG